MGVHSLKVTVHQLNNAGCCYEHAMRGTETVPRIARRYTIQCSLPNTHTVHIELDGGGQAGREAEKDGRERARGGREGGEGGRKR